MATVGSLVVNLLGNTQQFRAEFSQVPNMLRGVTGQILSLIGVGGGLAGMGKGLQLAATAEQASVAFEVLTGSVSATKKILGELQQYSDKSPYSLSGTTESTRLMLNFGIAVSEVIPDLKMIGDIAGGDEQKLLSLSLAFGQSASAGRLMGQDLNQMINAGFNPLVEISKRTGESMAMLKARMEAGAISTAEVKQAFVDATSEGGRFYGMTERQSGTMAGLWSTLRDTIDGVLRDIGVQLVKTFDLRKTLSDGIASLQSWAFYIRSAGNDLIVVGGIVVGFVAGLAAVKLALFAAAQAQAVLLALSGPKGWAMLAAGIFGAVVVSQQLIMMFDGQSAALNKVADSAKGATTAIDRMSSVKPGMTALAAELENLARIEEELKKTNLTPTYKKGLEKNKAVTETRVDALSAVSQAKPDLRPVDFLKQKLLDLKAAGKFDVFHGAEIDAQIGKLSGATEKIESLKDKINGLSQIDLDAKKLLSDGATEQQVAEFRRLSTEAQAAADRMKQLDREADLNKRGAERIAAMRDEIDLLNGSATRAQITMREMAREGFSQQQIDEAAKLQEQLDKLKDEGKKADKQGGGSKASLAGTAEAASVMLRGVASNGADPTAQASLVVQQKLLVAAEQTRDALKGANEPRTADI